MTSYPFGHVSLDQTYPSYGRMCYDRLINGQCVFINAILSFRSSLSRSNMPQLWSNVL